MYALVGGSIHRRDRTTRADSTTHARTAKMIHFRSRPMLVYLAETALAVSADIGARPPAKSVVFAGCAGEGRLRRFGDGSTKPLIRLLLDSTGGDDHDIFHGRILVSLAPACLDGRN